MDNSTVLTFTLQDDSGNEGVLNHIKGTLSVDKYGIAIAFDGHTMFTEDNGAPLYIEYHHGEVLVHIWGDVNEEDATNHISLEGARQSAANPDTIAFWDRANDLDPRARIAEAAHHHPECQCSICTHGGDAWLWLNHPSEY
jgi:hypothetical protein